MLTINKNIHHHNLQAEIVDTEESNTAILQEIYLRTADSLLLKKGEIILELNHNGADFTSTLFAFEPSIFYIGTEINKTKNLEAKYKNQNLYARGKADFICADHSDLNFENESFDKIFSINNLQHWNSITETLKEAHRLLKSDGRLVLTFDYDTLAKNKIFNIEEKVCSLGFSLVIQQKIKDHIFIQNNKTYPQNIIILHFAKI